MTTGEIAANPVPEMPEIAPVAENARSQEGQPGLTGTLPEPLPQQPVDNVSQREQPARAPLSRSIDPSISGDRLSASIPDYSSGEPLKPLGDPGGIINEILTIDSSIWYEWAVTENPNLSNSQISKGKEIIESLRQMKSALAYLLPVPQIIQSGAVLHQQEHRYITPMAINPHHEALIPGEKMGEMTLPLDQALANNNLEEILWAIEDSRNQEFQDYLGVTTTLPSQQMTLFTFQETLKKLTAQTGKQAAILYAISRSDRLEIILVPPEGNPIRKTIFDATPEVLFAVVNEFRWEITDPRRQNMNKYFSSGQQLYEWIIGPVAEDLKKMEIDTILFSLDPGLRSLPIAALFDGNQFLIEQYSISLIPSFSLTNPSYFPLQNHAVLAMGASQFSGENPLPAVPLELKTIVEQTGSMQSFLNEAFTVENLAYQHQQNDFKIIHLATHAEFNPGERNQSYIQLWDRRINLDELSSLHLDTPKVELLVLSACQTALGDRQAELGFGGLAVKSGVKTAIASLWSVNDEGTLGLMTELYQNLHSVPLKAEALRQAQLAMLRGEVKIESDRLIHSQGAIDLPPEISGLGDTSLSHPYYWSGFTLIGSPW